MYIAKSPSSASSACTPSPLRVLGDRFTARVNRTQLVESSTSREGSFSTTHCLQRGKLDLAPALPVSTQVARSSRWSLPRRHRSPLSPLHRWRSWMSSKCRRCACPHPRHVPRQRDVLPRSAWTRPAVPALCTQACWSIRSLSWRRTTMTTC